MMKDCFFINLDGIGSSNDGAPCLESGDDSSFGDGNALLLHSLVDGGPVLVVHLVELVYEADSLVGEHHRSSLERPLLGDGIFFDRSRQPDRRSSLSRSEDGS